MFRLLAITSVPHRLSICIIFIVLHLLGPVGCCIRKTVTVEHKDALIYRSIGARVRVNLTRQMFQLVGFVFNLIDIRLLRGFIIGFILYSHWDGVKAMLLCVFRQTFRNTKTKLHK